MRRQSRDEAEAAALEQGAEVLAKSAESFGGGSPAVDALEKALEILLRNEAERARVRARGGRSLAAIFPDREEAPA